MFFRFSRFSHVTQKNIAQHSHQNVMKATGVSSFEFTFTRHLTEDTIKLIEAMSINENYSASLLLFD